MCVFGSHTFVPISWMCKTQTCVSHSSTKSEIISVDTELRMDGIPVLDPWDLDIIVIHSNSNQKQKDKQARRNPLYDKQSEKRVNSQTNTPVSVNSTSHQTHATRTFFSSALRRAQVISLVHQTVIFGFALSCHSLVLMSVLSRLSTSHLLPLYRVEIPLPLDSEESLTERLDLKHRLSVQHRTHETDSTTIFDQKDNYEERVSLSVSEQIPHQKSRRSSRKSAADTTPTMSDSNRKCFCQRERDNVSKTSVFSHSIRSRKLESRCATVINESLIGKKTIGMKVSVNP